MSALCFEVETLQVTVIKLVQSQQYYIKTVFPNPVFQLKLFNFFKKSEQTKIYTSFKNITKHIFVLLS